MKNVISLSLCGSVLKSGYVFFVAVSLSIAAPVLCHAQAQEVLPLSQSAARIPDAPSALARISDHQVTLNVFASGSVVNLMPEAGQYESWTSWFRTRIQDQSDRNQPARSSADTKMDGISLMFAPARMPPKAIHGADDWQYYGHHIPVAGPLVLRVGEEAQAHPRVVAVFKMIQPQF